jgi:glutamate/tyrosine decarboxylase-like PLP-dependent enzyme
MSAETFQDLGHRLVDKIAEFLASLPARPAAPDTNSGDVLEALGRGSLPEEGSAAGRLIDEAADLLMTYSRLNGHPRSWGYVIGSPAPIGILGDFLASAINPNCTSWIASPAAAEMERQAVCWIADLLGYPQDGGGLLVSGGTMANFVGFLAARRAKAAWDVRTAGLMGGDKPRLRAYASEETHTWIQKAADMSGLGTDSIRWIPCDRDQRLDMAALRRCIEEDRANGDLPFLAVGTAGTVSTGAVDPLPELAELCRRHDLWFHVDGAYGAFAVAVPGTPPDLSGLRNADSIAVDGHKWLYLPLEVGCVLVRDPHALRQTFSYQPTYYAFPTSPGDDPIHYHQLGPQNSRGLRALKLWLALKQAGRDGYVSMISQDLKLARRLYSTIDESPDLEAVTQSLSITTFRSRRSQSGAPRPPPEVRRAVRFERGGRRPLPLACLHHELPDRSGGC